MARAHWWGSGRPCTVADGQQRAAHEHGHLHSGAGGRANSAVRPQEPALRVAVHTVRLAAWGRVPHVPKLASDLVSAVFDMTSLQIRAGRS